MNAVCIGPRYKWYSVESGKVELYDLENDPHEAHDIVATEREIAGAMGETYAAWFDDVCGERQLLDPEREPGVPILMAADDELPTLLTWQDWVPYDGEEGWSRENSGYWLVSVEERAVYRILVECEVDAPLVFQFGPVELRLPTVEKVQARCFELELPTVSAQLHCYYEQAGARVGPCYVSICRQKTGERTRTKA